MRKEPEPNMKSDLLNLVSPIFATAMIALVSIFPNPETALNSLRQSAEGPEFWQVTSLSNAEGVPHGRLPAATVTEIARTPCFAPNGAMSVVEIDLCADFILELTRALEDPRIARLFSDADPRQISPVSDPEYLRSAAVGLCRERWIRTSGNPRSLESPICVEAAVSLASRTTSS
jgi:hypothetical protein